jgi:hypothetical protein
MIELVRVSMWWQYKLAPVVGLFVATALIERRPLLALWQELVLVLIALAVCASYVSIVNDVTDRRDDEAAGKANRQLAYRRGAVLALLGATLAAGAAIAWTWRGEPWLVAAYAGSWLAYSLYSLPPFRLKARGLAGVACDAMGAHLFPALTTILAASGRVDAAWIAAAAVWALAHGVRGIVWHQLADYDGDVRGGVQTFAVRHRAAAARLVASVVFPIELAALAAMLWRIAEPLAVIALVCYGLLLAVRMPGLVLVVVVPRASCVSVMQEYYDLFLPVALLLSAAQRDWRAAVLLLAFAGLFPAGFRRLRPDFAKVAILFSLTLRRAGRVLRARTTS